jgi:acyl-CoA synthetase (AMP-forming)/AMP-acid ligase II
MALTERYRGFTVATALAHRVTVDPAGVFLRRDDDVLTFGEVDRQAEALAAGLHSLGIEAGDRLALVLPPCPEFVVSMLAAAKLGAVIVPLNPRLTVPELHYRLRHSEAAAAVTAESFAGVDFLAVFEDLMAQLPDLQYLVTVGEEDLWYDDRIFQFEDLRSAGDGRDYPQPAQEADRDPFAILYTSGTTGKPKGVVLSHTNLLQPAAGTADALGLGAADRVAGVSALFHVFGMGPGVLGCLLSGASLVLDEEMDGARMLDLVERHGVTVQYGIPTLFITAVREQRATPRDLGSLRLALVAGAPIAEETVRRIEDQLGTMLVVAYSVTETASTVALGRPEDPPAKRRFTVGRPLPGTRVRILEQGQDLPIESVGEIAVQGPGVMLGYHRQPQETRTSLIGDGFFLTGDLGMLDEEGFLHLVGRRREVIIRSGFNVYPRELEDHLHAHPAVHEATVVGVEHDVLGEAICACVVPVEGALVSEPEIRDWCRETLAEYKVPDLVRFFEDFPRTGTGKIRRVELIRLVRQAETGDEGRSRASRA